MLEIHCFITILENFIPCDYDNVEDVLPIIQNRIDMINKYKHYNIEIKVKNGQYYIEFSHFTNHLGQDFDELLTFFRNVGKIAVGSYGLFYMRNDEDPADSNYFKVWRLVKGEVTEFKDTLLSPFVTTVEEKGLINLLEKYTHYQNGDLSCKCELNITNETIKSLDFTKYDLGGSLFRGVTFDDCRFDGVYLSNSLFAGSILNNCILRDNPLRKAEWVYMTFNSTHTEGLDSFRTEFQYSKFVDSDFSNCTFSKSNFASSTFKNTTFTNCTFKTSRFAYSEFDNLKFVECSFDEVDIHEDESGVQLINCTFIK